MHDTKITSKQVLLEIDELLGFATVSGQWRTGGAKKSRCHQRHVGKE
jgi:hypothetical protein